MKTERILLPIDTRRCPVEIFLFVNGLADHCEINVTLLNVISLNILAPEARLYDELAAEAHFYLERIAKQYLTAVSSKTGRVRFGKPVEEILEQCREEPIDLVILPNDGCSFLARITNVWKGSSSPLVSPLIEKLTHESACQAMVVSSKAHFDCETICGRPQQSFTTDRPLAHVLPMPGPAVRASSQAEGRGEFPAQNHAHTMANALDASARKRSMAHRFF